MKTYPECYECIMRQSVKALKTTGISPDVQSQILSDVKGVIEGADPSLSPSALAGETNRLLRGLTGVSDFYREDKAANHQLAFSYLEDLRALLLRGEDLLEQGLKISAAGNVIDIIHGDDYDLWQEVENTLTGDLVGGGLEAFRARLNDAPYLLYLADNVGETVFDRVLIETLDIPVIYAVKSRPILNDATREDARAAGIDQLAEIIENGSYAPGTVLAQCSEEFLQLFQESELVISKGQANYETLDEAGEKVFFLLRVKCPVLSHQLDAPLGSLVFKQANPSSERSGSP